MTVCTYAYPFMMHDDDISICEKIRKVYPLPSVMICRSQNNPLHCTATARVQAAVIGFRFEEWDELEFCLEKCRTFDGIWTDGFLIKYRHSVRRIERFLVTS